MCTLWMSNATNLSHIDGISKESISNTLVEPYPLCPVKLWVDFRVVLLNQKFVNNTRVKEILT